MKYALLAALMVTSTVHATDNIRNCISYSSGESMLVNFRTNPNEVGMGKRTFKEVETRKNQNPDSEFKSTTVYDNKYDKNESIIVLDTNKESDKLTYVIVKNGHGTDSGFCYK